MQMLFPGLLMSCSKAVTVPVPSVWYSVLVFVLCTRAKKIMTAPHSLVVQCVIKLFSCAVGTLLLLDCCILVSFVIYIEL